MSKIGNDIKQILSTLAILAMQEADDYLAGSRESVAKPVEAALEKRISDTSLAATELQVAVPFSGQIHAQIVDYLLNTPYFTQARFDILAYGTDADLAGQAEALCHRLHEAGRQARVCQLEGKDATAYRDYRKANPELRFIVAEEEDSLAYGILNDSVFDDQQRHVPVVLIHTQSSDQEDPVTTT